MKKFKSLVKIQGCKSGIANWVIEHFPKDYEKLAYCEPCCGGGSICLNKNVSKSEVISDIDKGLISIWKTVRDGCEEFIDRLKAIKYCEKSFLKAFERKDEEFEDYFEHGFNEYILRRMSRGGTRKVFADSTQESGDTWEAGIEKLPCVAERLEKVVIVHKPLQQMVKIWDEPDSLLYLDPPYIPLTHKNTSETKENEMSVEDHIALLNIVKDAKGMMIISGYSSPLYNKVLENWKCVKREIPQQKGKERRFECLWFNYDLP